MSPTMMELFSTQGWDLWIHSLLHSLWQGVLVAGLLFCLLRSIPSRFANLRYALAIASLLVILLGLFVTRSILEETTPVSASTPWGAPRGEPQSSAPATSAGSNSMEKVDDLVMPQTETVATHSIPWSATISFLWVLGTLFMTLRIVAQGWGVRKIRRSCRPLEDRRIQGMAEEIRKGFGIPQEVLLKVSDRIDIPSVVGILWPAVLFPTSLLSGLPPDQIRAILAHELAHIRRWDYLVNLAQMGVEAILFFNPAVWWVSRQVRVEREVCCDFMAARALGSGLDYARALANLAATLPSISQPEMSPAFSGNQSEWHLLDRIKRLASPQHRPHLHLPWYSLIGLFLAGTVMTFGLWRGADAGVKVVKNLFLTPEQVERLVEIEEEFGPAEEEYEEGSTPEDKVTLSGIVRTRDGKPLTGKKSLKVRIEYPRGVTGTSGKVVDGRFKVNDRPGTYYLGFDSEGYAPTAIGPIDMKRGETRENIELVLDTGFTGRIRLVDLQGIPISGVRLSSHQVFDKVFRLQPKFEATTDSDGLALIPHCASLPLGLEANVEGYEWEIRDDLLPHPEEVLTWVLHPGKETSGRVVRREDGTPLRDAEIGIVGIKGPKNWSYLIENPRDLATTDEEGRFSTSTLRWDSRYRVVVDAPGAAPVLIEDFEVGKTDHRIELGPEVEIRGRIIGDLGKLNKYRGERVVDSNTEIRTENQRDGFTVEHYPRHHPVEIREGVGFFHISDLLPGKVFIHAGEKRVSVNPEGSVDDLLIDLDEPEESNPVHASTREVVFRFELPDDAPPVHGELVVFSQDEIRDIGRRNTKNPHYLKVDQNTARMLLPVPQRIFFEGDRLVGYWIPEEFHEPVLKSALDVHEGTEPHLIEIPAVPAGSIFGKVLEVDGSPAEEFLVSVSQIEESPRMEGFRGGLSIQGKNSSSTHDGISRFNVGPLPLDGTYRLVVHREHFYLESDPIEITADDPTREISFQFTDSASLEVSVLDPEGNPVPPVKIELGYSAKNGGSFGKSGEYTDRDGRHRFDQINLQAPGSYSLTVESMQDFQPVWLRNTPVAEGDLVIQLKPGLTQEGTLIDDRTGEPIQGMEISAQFLNHPIYQREGEVATSDKDLPAWFHSEGETDESGRFRFSNLAQGEYNLTIQGGRIKKSVSGNKVITGQSEQVELRVIPLNREPGEN